MSRQSTIPVRDVLCLVMFLLLTACGAPRGTPAPTPISRAEVGPLRSSLTPSGPPAPVFCAATQPPDFVKQLVLAKNTSATMEPVDATDVFEPAQAKFHALVSFENAPAATQLRAVWYLLQSGGQVLNAKLDETTNEVNGSGVIDFTLTPLDRTWLAGFYCVEIYAGDRAALTKRFRVEAAPAGNRSPIVGVTLAQAVAPNTFEPVNPTRVWPATARVIHAVVQIQDAAPGTRFRVLWQLPDAAPQEFELTTQGSRRLDFTLTPPGATFSPGAYHVQVYVNGTLDRTEDFTVE